jgi:translation initiation factor IF-2
VSTNVVKIRTEAKTKAKDIVVFPCQLTVLPQFIFNKKSPIIVGVHVDAGIVKLGTPIVVPSQEFVCTPTLRPLTVLDRDRKDYEHRKGSQGS